MSRTWRPVVFAVDVPEDGTCPACGGQYDECPCPGPTQDDLYEYREKNGVMQARPLPEEL